MAKILLPKVVKKVSKRKGLGYGSGKGGHTSGRGQKGQKARGSIGILFEGMKVKKSLLRRLPFQRGKLKFKSGVKKAVLVNVGELNIFNEGSEINLESLIAKKLVNKRRAQENGIKILGNGNLTKTLTVSLKVSKSAGEKIIKAGGKLK